MYSLLCNVIVLKHLQLSHEISKKRLERSLLFSFNACASRKHFSWWCVNRANLRHVITSSPSSVVCFRARVLKRSFYEVYHSSAEYLFAVLKFISCPSIVLFFCFLSVSLDVVNLRWQSHFIPFYLILIKMDWWNSLEALCVFFNLAFWNNNGSFIYN